MTDKSFGDHMNRNIPKNPLLSTAVTGLSLEDLTHNAVLLPVSLGQEVITRPDQQIGTQSSTLGHTDHAVSNCQSGDTNTNLTPSPLPLTIPSTYNIAQSSTSTDFEQKPSMNQSKASAKSSDDFDVNEYFARLHGTRYVSAPLNSVLKDDKNADLDAREENLEEINLNEPEKVEQQSLTSDIAQNFSQLPTMLPQVASAVFSSFSNMLQTRKSREPTPEARSAGYQDVQFERPPEPISEYVPPVAPPREPPSMPPTAGTANYRLPSKKKYAQIPGLSTGDSGHIPLQAPNLNLPPVSQNVPQYFVPTDFGHGPISQDLPPMSQGYPTSQNYPPSSQIQPQISLNQNFPPTSQVLPPTNLNAHERSQTLLLTTQNAPPMNQNISAANKIASQSNTSMAQISHISPPQYFVPKPESPPTTTAGENRLPNVPTNKEVPQYFTPAKVDNEPGSYTQNVSDQTYNIGGHDAPYFAPSQAENAKKIPETKENDKQQTIKAQIPTSYFVPTFSNEGPSKNEQRQIDLLASNIPVARETNQTPQTDMRLPSYNINPDQVLPPPPTFANVKRENQPTIGKGVLPPSVARRISSNQPIIKHSPQVTAVPENIFVPAPILEDTDKVGQVSDGSTNLSAFASFAAAAPKTALQSSASIVTLGLDSSVQGPKVPSFYAPIGSLPPTEKPGVSPESQIKHPTILTPSISSPGATSAADSRTLPPPSIFTPTIPASLTEMTSQSTSFVTSSAQSPAQQASNILTPPRQPSNFPQSAPPTAPTMFSSETSFFNPTSSEETKELTSTSSIIGPPKVPEPPKAAGNVNFRMPKKRPQYYAGPIEGVGAISNNVKPVIPPVNTGSFQGALFTPEVAAPIAAPVALNQSITPFDNVASAPFDINRSTLETAASSPFDINRPAEATVANFDTNRQETYSTFQGVQENTYNTAFDMSRKTTDSYEPSQESGGFGLFGSLKSKLSSLDINKIQDRVTTFFDPAYNDTKKEDVSAQQTAPYGHQQYTPYEHHGQTQSNFEIFVPNVEQASEAYQNPNYQPTYQTQYNYGQGNNYYQNQQMYNYYQNAGQNVSYFGDVSQNYQAPTSNMPQLISGSCPENIQHVTHADAASVPKIDESLESVPKYPQTNVQETEIQKKDKLEDSYSTVPSYKSNEKEDDVTTQYGEQNTSHSGAELQASFFDSPKSLAPPNEANVANNPNIYPQETPQIIGKVETGSSSGIFFDNLLMETVKSSSHKEETDRFNRSHITETTPKVCETETAMKNYFNNSQSHLPRVLPKLEENENQNIQSQEEKAMEHNTVTSFFDKSEDYDSNLKSKEENVYLKTSEIVKGVISSVIEPIEDVNPKTSDGQNVLQMQSNPLDFFGAFTSDTGAQNLFSNYELKEDSATKSALDKYSRQDDYIRDAPELSVSSAPLFGLSSMLADKTKELNDLEDEIRRMSIQEPDRITDDSFTRSTNVSFFENVDDTEDDEIKNEVSDLNICETCREVNKPDDREETDDLTTQLIENITSPIQLLNPVEVPLPEHINQADDREDFDSNQCAEISHITEETIETIQVQSATELLEDDNVKHVRGYGWSEEPVSTSDEHNYSVPYQTKLEKDFNLPVDPNSIGFFRGERGLFENMPANKDLEPDLKFGTPIVLPRQMSIPSAPPHEDDQKSDRLDVHSIEQDAKKDFPIYEDFVIEPDKDFKRSSESLGMDSFTSRVDKYKKKEEVETSPIFDLNATSSPSIPIPSYFDTGNYAAETHYRNSLTSPSNPLKVPPGFEDEFQRRLSSQDSGDRHDILPQYIPDTSTQTRPTYSPTFSQANVANFTTVTSSSMSGPRLEAGENVPLPSFENILKKDFVPNVAASKTDKEQVQTREAFTSSGFFTSLVNKEPKETDIKETTPDFSRIFHAKHETDATVFERPIAESQTQAKVLPDPINFFSATGVANNTNDEAQAFNRLASYFSSPAKTEQSKTFFELSQSQDHYRQDIKHDSNPKSYFPPNQTQNVPPNIHNIPQDQYLANLDLMTDLASYQNVEFKPETIVRRVNYFTIEYDDGTYVNEFNKGEPDSKIKEVAKHNIPENSETIPDDKTLKSAVENCTHCCNLGVGPIKNIDNINHELLTNNKVRKCMDCKDTDKKKDCDMEATKDVDNRQSITVNFDGTFEEESDGVSATATENRSSGEYTPVRHHWFYRIDIDGKSTWRGFSITDSRALEEAFNSPNLNENTLVATDGGRYDVNVKGRLRFPVYWTDKPANVRRCSWFYKGNTEVRYVPYTEAVAEKLEAEYRHGMSTGEWHRRLMLPNNELVVMHQPHVMVHFLQGSATDAFSGTPLFVLGKRVYRNPPKIRVSRDQTPKIDHLVMMVHGAGEYSAHKEKIQSTMRPRVVRRGCDESEIEEVEPSSIDHLLLLCHGVGSACDMKFRPVEQVVDDFRTTSLQLIQSHYRNSYDSGLVGRVEVLPISWHATLHSGETGVDKRLARITLDSIPRLRNFTNDTVLDVLFYTSPVFCQTIINTVCSELNRIYKLFCERNPDFHGGVSLGGHSLGSVILYDLLCHQQPSSSQSTPNKVYVSGAAGTGQPTVDYPSLNFSPTALYALGSPIAIFECIRGVESLGPAFALPTCKNFFNIFHPYDPIAYRIEPLINPLLRDTKPHLIPHHKGRKRMHLELKDTMARVGADIKQKLIESIKTTWSNMWKTQQPPTDKQLEKVVEEEMEKEHLTEESMKEDTASNDEVIVEENVNDESGSEELRSEETTPDMLGALNSGRRIDYVLQEAPFEMINEYLFAMSSHVCYWESEDTMLLMLREIYDALGVQPDSTLPQSSLTVQRTRPPRADEKFNVIVNSTENPSTSRGTT